MLLKTCGQRELEAQRRLNRYPICGFSACTSTMAFVVCASGRAMTNLSSTGVATSAVSLERTFASSRGGPSGRRFDVRCPPACQIVRASSALRQGTKEEAT